MLRILLFRAVLLVLILCSVANAQLAIGDKGATVRLLQRRLLLPEGAADAALLAGVRSAAGLPPNAAIGKGHVRKALELLATPAQARCAVWVDTAEWVAGTTPAQKAATIDALIARGRLHTVAATAAMALEPQPTLREIPPILVMLGEHDEEGQTAMMAWRERAAALTPAFAAELLQRIRTGAWLGALPPAAYVLLQAELAATAVDAAAELAP